MHTPRRNRAGRGPHRLPHLPGIPGIAGFGAVGGAVLTVAALAAPLMAAPAAGSSTLASSLHTSWSMAGQRGGTVAGGKKYSFSRLTVSGDDEALNFQVASGNNSFVAAIAPPSGATFANTSSPITFSGARNTASSSSAELNVSGNGAGCEAMLGQFTIYQASFDSDTGQLTSISMTFDQHCDGQIPALLGSIAFDSASSPHSLPSLSGGPKVTHISATVKGDQLSVRWTNPNHNFGGTAVIIRRDKAAPKSPLGYKAACQAEDHTNICRFPDLAPGAWYSAAVYELDASGDPSKAVSVSTDASGMSVVPQVGSSGWILIGRGRANSSGLVRATVKPNSNTYYRFAFLGKGSDGAALSPPVLVTVRPVITISITKTEIASGGTSYIQGTVTADAPVTLQLEEEWEGKWSSGAQETAVGGDVSYWFEIIGHSPGTAEFRIDIPASRYYASTESGTVHCTVT